MKLTIERATLLKSLAHVQSVVEKRNAIPILSNVLIDARGGQVHLSATDMDIDIVDTASATVSQDGATTAPVHTMYDIVRKLPEGAQVEIALDGDSNQLKVKSGRSNFSLSCLPREDFPTIGGGDLPTEFQLAADDLRTLIDRTRFAVSTDETRYYLNGIYLHAADQDGLKLLRAVATDGHRLARLEMPLPEGAESIPGVIVPRKAVAELRRLIDDSSEPITIGVSETKIRFRFDDVVLTSKLIDGTFPDYERVIPSGNDKKLELDARAFTQAVDRVATISTEKSRAIKLLLENGTLTLQANSPDAGSAMEEQEVAYDGDKIDIGFNARYLLEITQQIEGDVAQFMFADSGSPTIIKDVADSSALFVLMPMRV